MRFLLLLAAASCITGCASTEYSDVPEPSGEWVPANPPGLTGPSLTGPILTSPGLASDAAPLPLDPGQRRPWR